METVGDYEYSAKDLIGHGAFAVVFKGRKRMKPNETVAIKSITKKNLSKSQNLLGKEIKILKELTELNHENVVALLDCKETAVSVYLVMEYCNGGDLADYLHAKGTLSEDTIRLFLRQLVGAMRAINGKGIVHRDLKPQNILLCHSPGKVNPAPHEIKLKIADFGFARFLGEGTMAATLCGSPMYMAPEVIMSLQYDAKADLWSIGTIVFQCLTGKAPFQAQTPQMLKHYYEKNAKLAPKIPPGTSQELGDLLIQLLKRNAKDRLEFDDFFSHPFIKKMSKPSSPVPVPTRRSLSREMSPAKPLNESPMSAACGGTQGSPEELSVDMASLPGGSLPTYDPPGSRTPNSKGHGSPSSAEEQDDFVLVPNNLAMDNIYDRVSGNGNNKRKSSDLCSTPPIMIGSPMNRMTGLQSPSPPSSAGLHLHQRQSPSPHGMPSPSPRPSYLPVTNSPGSGGGASASPSSPVRPLSEPVPVPTQREAYQLIQQSLRESSPGSPRSGSTNSRQSDSGGQRQPNKVARSQPMSLRRQSSTDSVGRMVPDISSLSPPLVQFAFGTPPSGGRWSGVMPTTPPGGAPWACLPNTYGSGRHTPTSSPVRKPSLNSSPVNCNYFFNGSGAYMPPALMPTPAFSGGAQLHHHQHYIPATLVNCNTLFPHLAPPPEPSMGLASPSLPLMAPFGARSRSLPESGSSAEAAIVGSGLMDIGSQDSALLPRSGSAGRLNETLNNIRVAFVSSQGGATGGCQYHFGTSPPNMEGPVFFVAPELPEETLLDREHTETLAKLNFCLELVDCVLEIAKNNSLDHLSIPNDSYGRAEQLVLYMKALHLLSNALSLSRKEIKIGKLHPSNTVKNVVSVMNDKYHYCLVMCKTLNSQNILQTAKNDPQSTSISAEQLIYQYVTEICQSAALDEVLGKSSECYRRYQMAQVLLHALAQQITVEEDRQRLIRYKEAVERRLYILKQQGIVYSYETSCNN